MDEEKSSHLDDPTGGPSVPSESGRDERDQDVDPSAGAQGQDPGEGAAQESEDQAGGKPSPG